MAATLNVTTSRPKRVLMVAASPAGRPETHWPAQRRRDRGDFSGCPGGCGVVFKLTPAADGQ